MVRKAQDLPVNMIVLTALALLVLVVVGAFFISGFGQASSSVNIIEADQAECQSICQTLVTTAFNYNVDVAWDEDNAVYTGLGYTNKAKEYACRCVNYGACTVTLRDGSSFSVEQAAYTAVNAAETFDEDGICNGFIE
ncbi:MAG: hypothetical protein WC307_03985 [Candidatus Nanoarchaeia archaeon]|jgi:hypothetical protein